MALPQVREDLSSFSSESSASLNKIKIHRIANRSPKIDFNDPCTAHDKILLVEDRKFFVESQYLSAMSPVFRKMLEESGEADELPIPNVKADHFQVFLLCIYPRSCEITAENCSYVLDLAFQFSMPTFIHKWAKYMDRNWDSSMEHVLQMFHVVYKYNLSGYMNEFGTRFFTCERRRRRNLWEELKAARDQITKMSSEEQTFILQWLLTPPPEGSIIDLTKWRDSEEDLPRIPVNDFNDPTTPHDRILVVEGKEFYVNSKVLGVWSDFFRVLLQVNEAKRVEVRDVSADAFNSFLQTIYQDGSNLTFENLPAVLELSVRFASPGVEYLCSKATLSIGDYTDFAPFMDILEVAIKHNIEDVKMFYVCNWFIIIEEGYGLDEEIDNIAKCSLELKWFILQFKMGVFNKLGFQHFE